MLKNQLCVDKHTEKCYRVWAFNVPQRYIRCTSKKFVFSSKKHVEFGRMIKSALFKVCSIAWYTFFGQFVNTTPVKLFSFCWETFIEPFSHIFVRRTEELLSKCVTHRCAQVIIGRSQVWWVNRMGSNFPAESFQRVVNQCCHSCRSMVICVASFGSVSFWTCLKQKTVQIGQLLFVTFSINRFPKF